MNWLMHQLCSDLFYDRIMVWELYRTLKDSLGNKKTLVSSSSFLFIFYIYIFIFLSLRQSIINLDPDSANSLSPVISYHLERKQSAIHNRKQNLPKKKNGGRLSDLQVFGTKNKDFLNDMLRLPIAMVVTRNLDPLLPPLETKSRLFTIIFQIKKNLKWDLLQPWRKETEALIPIVRIN